ncbi:MAG: GntR family transcriptional regulator [Aldersonia sp.]|nr:GntR family transcriptional regulator [Aldersonia sp.]
MSRSAESVPAYRRLSRELRGQIAAGRYRGGTQLPTESELAEEYALSRQTVRRAFQDLVADGIVYRVPGRGTFATEKDGRYLRQLGSIDDLMNLSTDTTMEVLEPLRRRVDIEAASRLRLDTDVVHRMVFRRFHDEVPFVVTTAFLPEWVARLIAELPELQIGAVSPNTIIGLAEPHLPHPIVEAAQSITVGAADATAARALDCPVGHPMLRVDRLYTGADGRATELATSLFLPEHYTYRVTLRRTGR